MPLKRSEALRPLSSEHHDALVWAFRAKNASVGRTSAGIPSDPEIVRELILRFAEGPLARHFRAEEAHLAAHLPGESRKRLEREHRELDAAVSLLRAGAAPEAFARFSAALETHVRWEERELFPALEAAIGAETLARVGDAIAVELAPGACARR